MQKRERERSKSKKKKQEREREKCRSGYVPLSSQTLPSTFAPFDLGEGGGLHTCSLCWGEETFVENISHLN